MAEKKQIVSICLDRLVCHRGNPNVMSEASFGKLVGHLRRTGNYEPLVVRRHKKRRGYFEIINGHHRAKALGKVGVKEADCVVWDVDDDEVLVLLATLNRLSGHDKLEEKSKLIKSLSRRFSVKELVKRLPESAKSIERLRDLYKTLEKPGFEGEVFLRPVVFFLNGEQKRVVDEALASAIGANVGTRAQKTARAIVEIAETYIKREVK